MRGELHRAMDFAWCVRNNRGVCMWCSSGGFGQETDTHANTDSDTYTRANANAYPSSRDADVYAERWLVPD